MKHLRKYNESKSDNQEIFDDLMDCFVDLIDNDLEFDEKEHLSFNYKNNKKSFGEINETDELKEIVLSIGYKQLEIKEEFENNCLDDNIEYFKTITIFLEEIKTAINRFNSMHNLYYKIDYSEIYSLNGYITINFYL